MWEKSFEKVNIMWRLLSIYYENVMVFGE
jgi:hypothetical protein